jgi:hypothetical protein
MEREIPCHLVSSIVFGLRESVEEADSWVGAVMTVHH